MFESLIWSALRGFDPARPVFVEAESKKIGNLRVPETLIAAMWESKCVKLEAAIDLRVAMLIDEYRHFVADAGALGVQLDCLTAHYGEQKSPPGRRSPRTAVWDALVRELLETTLRSRLYALDAQALSTARSRHRADGHRQQRSRVRTACYAMPGRHLQAIARPLIFARYAGPAPAVRLNPRVRR